MHVCAGVNVGPVHPHHAPYTPLSPPSQPSLRHEPSGPPGVDSHSQAPAQAPSQAPQAQDSAANGLTATEPAAKQQATAKQEADPAATQQPDTKAITPEAPSPAPALTEEPKGSAGAAAQADGQQSQGGGTDTAEAAPAADSQLAQSTSTEAGTSSSLSFLKSPKCGSLSVICGAVLQCMMLSRSGIVLHAQALCCCMQVPSCLLSVLYEQLQECSWVWNGARKSWHFEKCQEATRQAQSHQLRCGIPRHYFCMENLCITMPSVSTTQPC